MKIPEIINFDKKGLVKAIVQDGKTKDVLMLAYMNKEALKKTLTTGKMVYWSRRRKSLWTKGEESRNFQILKEFFIDCDGDTLLFKVKQIGGSCHEGYKTCFFRKIDNKKIKISKKRIFDPKRVYNIQIINELFDVIKNRKENPTLGSYTSSLMKKGEEEINGKFLEECKELTEAKKKVGKNGLIWEAADVLYHFLIFLVYKDIDFLDVCKELRERRDRNKWKNPTFKYLNMNNKN